jgi:hypothetical protein
MSTQVTQVYRIAQGGMTPAALAAIVSATSVPTPTDVLTFMGARVTSDSVASPPGFAVRTIIYALGPSVTATALSTVDSDGHVSGINITAPGADYVIPPIIILAGGDGGSGIESVAHARAWLKVVSATITAPGSGYHLGTTATVVGQLAPSKPDAKPAKLSLTIGGGGAITAVTIVDPGTGYVGIPTVVIADPAASPGSGGAITLSMGVGQIDVFDPGEGYALGPIVIIRPAFIEMFPNETDQGAPFDNLILVALQSAVASPVEADAPIVV